MSVFGLLLIKKEFAYENEYLVSSFESELALDKNYKISLELGEINIHDDNGLFLFSIERSPNPEIKTEEALKLFILFQLLLMLTLTLIIKFYKSFNYIIHRKYLIP